MIPGRTKGSLARFFRYQGPGWCRNVQVVVSDGSRSYQAAITRYLPDAQHVLDRFHVARRHTRRAHPGPTRAPTPPPPRAAPDVRTGPVQSPFHPATAGGSPHRRPPETSRPPLQSSPPAPHRLGDAPRALRRLYEADDRDGANQAPGRFADLYDSGQTPRIPGSSRHHHRPRRRNPGLPHHQTGLQRTPRRHQQPPPWSYDASHTGSPTTATTQPAEPS